MKLLWWRHPTAGPRRILVPFTRGLLDQTVLDAAIRIARAEEATLVPAYLILIPLEFDLDAPMRQECERGIPLLEAVEHAASKAGIAVDARVESGRTPIHALRRLWEVEHFDRIVVPAPIGREPGFEPDELLWMLTHAPSETLILRPDPALHADGSGANGRPPLPVNMLRAAVSETHSSAEADLIPS
jgi:nucleotide-binding universal stress UspA family protein